jgi:hypothetical protein
VNGRLQKNGGNVASYFCTADSRVVHAIAKPVSADKLLQAAVWAVETHRGALLADPQDLLIQRDFVQQAHLAKLDTTRESFRWKIDEEMPAATKTYDKKMKDDKTRWKESPESAFLIASRRAAQKLGGNRAHQIMAAQPLAKLREVYKEVFEELTNERVIKNRGVVYTAAKTLEAARESGTPVLLVFYDGKGDDKDEWDSKTKDMVKDVLGSPRLVSVLRNYAKVYVPKRQIAALSNLTKMPLYEEARNSTPVLIITDSTGTKTGSLCGTISPDQLAIQLWPAIHMTTLAHAQKLAEMGELTPALKVLQRVRTVPTSAVIHQRTLLMIDQVKLMVGEKWLAEGRHESALKILAKLSRLSGDEDVRRISADLVVRIRTENAGQ